MREREITKEEVSVTLALSTETKEMRKARQGAFRHLGGDSYLVVIFERHDEDFIIVTALKVDRNRLKKYGFARV